LISVPSGRFAADASLSRRAKLPGGVGATGCWSRRRYHRTWCS